MPGHGGGLDAPKTAQMTGRRLPIGIRTFRKMRERDCYYVDKTAYVERLLREGTHYFLSRPRRFGKRLDGEKPRHRRRRENGHAREAPPHNAPLLSDHLRSRLRRDHASDRGDRRNALHGLQPRLYEGPPTTRRQ